MARVQRREVDRALDTHSFTELRGKIQGAISYGSAAPDSSLRRPAITRRQSALAGVPDCRSVPSVDALSCPLLPPDAPWANTADRMRPSQPRLPGGVMIDSMDYQQRQKQMDGINHARVRFYKRTSVECRTFNILRGARLRGDGIYLYT